MILVDIESWELSKFNLILDTMHGKTKSEVLPDAMTMSTTRRANFDEDLSMSF